MLVHQPSSHIFPPASQPPLCRLTSPRLRGWIHLVAVYLLFTGAENVV